jgi:hypothetical protein
LSIELSKVRERLDHERRTLARSGEVLEQDSRVSRLISPDGTHHTIIYSSLDVQTADAAIAEEISHYRELDAEVEWKLYQHDMPGDLISRLEKLGFEIGERESVLVLDLLDLHDWIDHPPPHRCHRISDLKDLDLYRQAAEEILRKDYQFTTSELASGISNGSTEHLGYLCFDGAIPVSIGRLYTRSGSVFGGLYGGATLPAYQRAGFYRAVTAVRARDARELGARYLIVDALPTSCGILQRLGFVEISQTWPCVLRRVPRR